MSESATGTETTEEVDGSETPVITELRQQLRDAQKRAKELSEAKDKAVQEVRLQVRRETEAEREMQSAGYPKLSEVFLEKVEGDITVEAVDKFLGDLGLERKSGEAQGDAGDSRQSDRAGELAKVANLSQQVASAASGLNADSVQKRLEGASSSAEIHQIMAEAGLLHSYT